LGAIVGLGKGVLGVVTKPIAGLAEAGASVLGATRKVVTSAERIERIRLPRAFPIAAIGIFRVEEARLQFQACQMDRKPYQLRIMIKDRGSPRRFVIFNRMVCVFEGEKPMVADMASLRTIEGNGTVLRFRGKLRDGREMPFSCEGDSGETVRAAFALLRSRVAFCTILGDV
jgi:hypothetical protein